MANCETTATVIPRHYNGQILVDIGIEVDAEFEGTAILSKGNGAYKLNDSPTDGYGSYINFTCVDYSDFFDARSNPYKLEVFDLNGNPQNVFLANTVNCILIDVSTAAITIDNSPTFSLGLISINA